MNRQQSRNTLRLDPGDVIPDHWTTDETTLVYDFLLTVLTAIYDRYEDHMLSPLGTTPPPPTDDGPGPSGHDGTAH